MVHEVRDVRRSVYMCFLSAGLFDINKRANYAAPQKGRGRDSPDWFRTATNNYAYVETIRDRLGWVKRGCTWQTLENGPTKYEGQLGTS